MKFNIAVLPGDGIGPEISVQGVDVMSAVCEKFGHEVSYVYAICGADAIDKVGDPFPE
jgi:3-isopropylmalate dehydrogenase